MSGEKLLKLFEQNWSERSIFKKHKNPLNLNEPEIPEEEEEEESTKNIPVSFFIERTTSDDTTTMMTTTSSKTSLFNSSTDDDLFLSPRSVLTVKSTPMKLQKILSGKEVNVFSEVTEKEKQRKKKQSNNNVRRTRTRRGKSMSDLEYEEIKGFMDLGFVFSEEDHKDSDLVSILPGLQRLVKKEEEKEEEDKRNGRPYLSEVWDHCGGRKGKKQITPEIKWKVPAPVTTNEVDLKGHLKLWAHAVASTIR